MAKVAGTAFITIDGILYRLRGNMNISIGGFLRESISGLDGYHGMKETGMPGSIECDLTDTPELDINRLEELENVTVKVVLINGKIAVLGNANQMNHIQMNADDGKFTVKFEGPKGQWIPTTQAAQTA